MKNDWFTNPIDQGDDLKIHDNRMKYAENNTELKRYWIYELSGNLTMEGVYIDRILTSYLSKGIYILQTSSGIRDKLLVK